MTQAGNIPATEVSLGALRRSMSTAAAEVVTPPIDDLRSLLVHELERAEDAELQAAATLRRFASATDSLRLRRLLQQRIHEGERVSSDIRVALEQYSSSHRHVHNRAAAAIVAQTDRLLKLAPTSSVGDIIILGGAQKLQAYCLSCWGVIRLLAKLLEDNETALQVKGAIEEGQRWDRQLTELALAQHAKTATAPALVVKADVGPQPARPQGLRRP